MSEQATQNGQDAFSIAMGANPELGAQTIAMPASPMNGTAGVGLAMPVRDPAGLEKAEPGADEAGQIVQSVPLCELAAHVKRVFEIARVERDKEGGVSEKLLEVRRIYEGDYSEDEKGLIENTGLPRGHQPFFQNGSAVSRGHRSMTGDVWTSGGDKPWTMDPTPDPDMPEEVTEASVLEAMQVIAERQKAIAALAETAARKAEALGQDPAAARAAVLADPDTQPLTPQQMATLMPHKVEEVKNRVLEEAKQRCELMERKIHDQLVEGEFYDKAQPTVLDYLSIYGTAVMRGPVPRMKRVAERRKSKDGVWQIKMVEKPVLSFEAIDPMDCYPAPDSREIGDSPLVITTRFSASDLRRFSKAKGKLYKGWNPDAVNRILSAAPQGGIEIEPTGTDAVKAEENELSNRAAAPTASSGKTYIDALEYFGEARGSELVGIGLRKDTSGKELDPEEYYDVNCIVVQDAVVYCRIMEPEIGWPLAKAVCYRSPQSWWGTGPIWEAKDDIKLCNSFIRAMVVNMSEASGAMMMVELDRLAGGTDLKIRPHKVWGVKDRPLGMGSQSGSPIQILKMDSVLGDLMNGYKFAKTEIGDHSGVPSYAFGSNTGSASAMRTASTLSMLNEGTTRGIKDTLYSVDRDEMRPVVMRLYAWNMLYSDDDSIKGDMTCNPGGLMGLVLVEQEYNRMVQFLNLANNGTDLQIVDIQARAYIYRKIAQMLHLNPDRVVATYEMLHMKQNLADLQQKLQIAQQEAALANTQAGKGGGDNGKVPTQGPSVAGPEGPVQGAAPRAGAAGAGNPGGSPPSMETAASALSGGPGGGLTPSARGTIRSTITNPQARAAAGARSAATRGPSGGGEG